MAKFERSLRAKLNRRHFKIHYREYMVYVEGEVDRVFWEKIFPTMNGWKPNVDVLRLDDMTVVGGWKNLVNYLEIQRQNKTSRMNFIVAIDGDYDEIIKHKPNYPNLVKTKRYALENYLFCPKSLNEYMQSVSKNCFNDVSTVYKKLMEFANIVKNLIIIDCINEKDKHGLKVYNLISKDLATIDNIKNYVKKISSEHKDIINQNKHLLDGHNLLHYVRWKIFVKQLNEIIYNEVCNAINIECRKSNNTRIIKMPQKLKPDDGLYTFCLKNCELCRNCTDYQNLKIKAQRAFDSLQLT